MATLLERLDKLGLKTETVPTDQLCSASAALACFPMYMVSNVHGWTPDTQFQIPVLNIPGFEAIREAFAIGREEGKLGISNEHRQVLSGLLTAVKPADLIIYEYALETINLFLASAQPAVVTETKVAIARMCLTVATAAGEGLLGTGEKINRHEFRAINRVAEELSLRDEPEAAKILKEVDEF